MRRPRVRLLLLTVAVLSAAVPALSQAVRRRPGEEYALLIAVRQYEPSELRSLKYTEADVEALADTLVKAGYPRENIRVMTQTRGAEWSRLLPTAANIRTELRLVLKNMVAADRVVVALAGHGVQLLGSEESYFCPSDARLNDKSTLIPLTQVYSALEACGAGSKVLLVDACRNDPLSEHALAVGRPVVDLTSLSRPLKKRTLGGVAALFSCSGGEKAFEDPELKHGVFFHFVLKGLTGEADFDGDGSVDLDELAAFTKRRVYRHVERVYRIEQTPELLGKGNLMELARLVPRNVPEPVKVKPVPEVRGYDKAEGEPRVKAASETKAKAKTESKVKTESKEKAKAELASRTPIVRTETAEAKAKTARPIGIKLVLIPAGEFMMGSADDDTDFLHHEKPRHKVRITRPFFLGTTEVTQGQYGIVTGENPGRHKGSDDLPVEWVSWSDAITFCNRLSEREGLKPYYLFGPGARTGGDGYRLPTEAEWEYACRAGTATRYSFGGDAAGLGDYAWFGANSGNQTHPVGQKRANAFGLHDMHGNVSEWCWDGYDAGYYSRSAATDPTGFPAATSRVTRGGGWIDPGKSCRSANRNGYAPGVRSNDLGFRVARSQPGS